MKPFHCCTERISLSLMICKLLSGLNRYGKGCSCLPSGHPASTTPKFQAKVFPANLPPSLLSYRHSRLPPLTQSSFAILPRSRMFALEKISIATPRFDAMTLNSYTNLRTIILRLSGDIFLARSDLPGRGHPRTIRRVVSTKQKATDPLCLTPDQPTEGLDDDGPDQYYQTLREVDDDAVLAYALRRYDYNGMYYNNMALMCRGISPSVDVFVCFVLRHLGAASVSNPDEACGRQVLVSCGPFWHRLFI